VKYKMQRLLVMTVGAIFVVIGAGAVLVALPRALHGGRGDDWSQLIFGIFFGGVGFAGTLLRVLRISALERKAGMTFKWFKDTYPQSVSGDRITCISCSGTRIHVRGLMQQSYLREHFCTRCGTALYYSPES
jgi:hypothetical protein